MDNKALWILGALLAVGGGYGACALSTSSDTGELASDPSEIEPPLPEMPELAQDSGVPMASPVTPEPTTPQPTMPQPTTPTTCDGACGAGEICRAGSAR
jgi:hypothetical protein